MSVSIREITSPEDPAFARILPLYERAFPPDERVPPEEFRQWTTWDPSATRRDLILSAESPDGTSVGFMASMIFVDTGIGYLVYLAVDEASRGQGIGETLFAASVDRAHQLVQAAGNSYRGALLEVERVEEASDAADRATRQRRLDWYSRLGASILTPDYTQPALAEDLDPVPLNLMWHGPPVTPEVACEVITDFYQRIYELAPDHPYVVQSLAGLP